MYPRIALLIVLSVSIFQQAQAQLISDRFRDVIRTHMEFGFQVGSSGYIGEINKDILGFNSFTWGGGVKVYFVPISRRLGSLTGTDNTFLRNIRLDYNWIDIKGDDSKSRNVADQQRGITFANRLHEISLGTEMQWKNNFGPRRKEYLKTLYIVPHIGVLFHNPKVSHPNSTVAPIQIPERPQWSTHGSLAVTKTAFFVGTAIGWKINLKGPVSIGPEISYRYALNDLLDGVSGYQNVLGIGVPQPPLSAATLLNQTKGGRSKIGDVYMTATFRITYTLYKWRDPLWK